MYSGSGHLNMSWVLSPISNLQLDFFPPPHDYAFSHWEDPWFVQEKFLTPFENIANFIKFIRQILYNLHQSPSTFLHISFLAPAISIIAIYKVLHESSNRSFFIFLSIFLLPGGYLIFHFEDRFLWPVSLLIMIAGIYYFNNLMSMLKDKKRHRIFLWMIYFGSFLLEPINQLKDSAYLNKNVHTLATALRKHNLRGRFTSNTRESECGIISYLNRDKYYWPNKRKNKNAFFIQEAKNENINFYLFFYNKEQEKVCFLNALSRDSYKKITNINDETIAIVL